MRQEFICHECGLESHVNLPRGWDEDALTVFEKINAEHNKWSPECGATADRIKRLKSMILDGTWPHTQAAGALN